ncbi:phage immunity [Geomicrobium sp. JCM 19037]|uniref:helix-turn-helix domain-containing protein n=1 Tax=Geomicrobium sp. JCM 19037 TaxID=1460634 RepID=UPI00045F2249|nr:helix-turn-helix transcriptional regulator [Geomicrobium sp. JCM 19037]GAK05646.1 phage immunity [Geomicrobium sp. JCM 19037]
MSNENNIKEMRKAAKLTQNDLAKKAGISRSYLADVENFRYNASLSVVKRIASVLGVSITELVEDHESEEILLRYNDDQKNMHKKLDNILPLLTNVTGIFHEEVRDDLVYYISLSEYNLSGQFNTADEYYHFEERYKKYLEDKEDFNNKDIEELQNEFDNKLNAKTIKQSFADNDYENQIAILEALEFIIERHELQSPNNNERMLINSIELSDDETIKNLSMTLDGKEVTEKEAQAFISYLRSVRQFDSE